MNDTTKFPRVAASPVKPLLFMLPCFLFFCINCLMLFTLLRKPALLESSRYILFGHLLFIDSLQLLISMLLYIFAVSLVQMISYVCIFVTMFATMFNKMSPLNVATMSLERYVAICFPLRHAEITTSRRTGIAIAFVWALSSVEVVTQLFLFISLENTSFTLSTFCNRNTVFQLQIYFTLSRAFTITYFALVALITIYTYIAIMITVKSASSDVSDGSKAHKTVLLHMVQLCMCLTSTLFTLLNSNSLWNTDPATALNIQYALFLTLNILPKCLSPLIYGLRDQAFRQVFKCYFKFDFKTGVLSKS